MIVDVVSIPELFGASTLNMRHPGTKVISARDYVVLGSVALRTQPRRMFEIGTYEGATSQFFLDLLPDVHVVSIATLDARFNNSSLGAEQVGCLVTARDRYTQIIGDSHKVQADAFVTAYGSMDFVFIDGDHSREGVEADTELALAILAPDGVVFWHDANHPRYVGVLQALRKSKRVVAREGNLACWSSAIEEAIGGRVA